MLAFQAAEEMLRATGHTDPGAPWVPIGIGVHTGVAYIGALGSDGTASDMTVTRVSCETWWPTWAAFLPQLVVTVRTLRSPPATNANGTGPFKLESYQPDSRTVLTVNEAWWDKPEHNLTRIEFRPIKSDATRVAALLSGDIDMMAPAPLQDLGRIGAAPGEEPSPAAHLPGDELAPGAHSCTGRKNRLLELKVRQAPWHAVDLVSRCS